MLDSGRRSLWNAQRAAVDHVADRLRRLVLPSRPELAMQNALEKVFADEWPDFAREVPTVTEGKAGRLDFLLRFGDDAIAIECKAAGSFDQLLTQVERYLAPTASLALSGLIIVASKSRPVRDFPTALHDKPIAVVWSSIAAL